MKYLTLAILLLASSNASALGNKLECESLFSVTTILAEMATDSVAPKLRKHYETISLMSSLRLVSECGHRMDKGVRDDRIAYNDLMLELGKLDQ